MYICMDHSVDIAYAGLSCPACDIQAEVDQLGEELKEKSAEIDELTETISELRGKK